jgi:diguanylate cyclase (GGDEF)-like protein
MEKLMHNAGEAGLSVLTEAREQIRFLSFHDPLTGLPNRRLGLDRLQQALACPRGEALLAVLYVDLDKFKYVNDIHGHDIGDALLQAVARRLSDEIGHGDTLCRTSSNEFMAILPGMASHDDISIMCARMLSGLSSAFELKGVVLNISCCIGVAVALGHEHGRDCETLMRKATTALHEAKKAGASRYRFFEEHMSARLAHYVQTRDALTLALERDEFELHYQPQIDLGSGQVVGVEALIRWRRPGHGLIPPGAFIGVAEESGLIVPIGRWVLQQACRQAAAWHAVGWEGIRIAVNLSSVQFCAREELVEDVFNAISASGLDPCCLELELTESSLLEHDQQIASCIRQWKASGIQLSIDDFGTGYSSLAYLKRLDVDKLKIDRAFIVGILEDEQDRAIVEAMVRIARSLKLCSLAEGVENAAEAALLAEIGCDQAQGYLYSRPLPAADMEHWLHEHHHAVVAIQHERPALHRHG